MKHRLLAGRREQPVPGHPNALASTTDIPAVGKRRSFPGLKRSLCRDPDDWPPAVAQAAEVGLISWTRDRPARFKCLVGVSFAVSLARTASGKLQKQAIRASLSSVAAQ
jgi:hypothetical protein